jgi:hypothetical protein
VKKQCLNAQYHEDFATMKSVILKTTASAHHEHAPVPASLLTGPFIQGQRDFSRPWVGSRNQEFVFLTERYRHLEPVIDSPPSQLEVQVLGPGALRLNGMAPAGVMARFSEDLARLGLRVIR